MPSALVIEDNRNACETLCQLLRLFDVATRPAYNLKAALMSLGENLPDLIFLDLELPGSGGSKILSHLCHEARLAHIPVVAVSAADDPGVYQTAPGSNIRHIIRPPASLLAVEQALHKAGVV